MRAAVLSAPGQVSVEEVPDPAPAPDEVVVAVRSCGICGTDLHIVSGDIGSERLPLVPGHEPWGEVVADHRLRDSAPARSSPSTRRCTAAGVRHAGAATEICVTPGDL